MRSRRLISAPPLPLHTPLPRRSASRPRHISRPPRKAIDQVLHARFLGALDLAHQASLPSVFQAWPLLLHPRAQEVLDAFSLQPASSLHNGRRNDRARRAVGHNRARRIPPETCRGQDTALDEGGDVRAAGGGEAAVELDADERAAEGSGGDHGPAEVDVCSEEGCKVGALRESEGEDGGGAAQAVGVEDWVCGEAAEAVAGL